MPQIHTMHLQVAEDAIDVNGHVNNQEYLRWMQEIAIEHCAAQGWPMERYLDAGTSWYARSHFIEYLRPARLGDEITACTWVATFAERDSLRRTLFLRPADHRILARAETRWIFVDTRLGRSIPITPEVRSGFEIVGSEDDVLRELGWSPHAPRLAGHSAAD